MEFYSRTKKPATIPAPQCSKFSPTFSLKINKNNGKKELVKTGETNTYEKIQAGKEQTLVYNILDRYNKGEIEVLNQTQGAYGDFTNMPTSLAEAQQRLIDAEKTFESLPLEVRREFNHSTTEFLSSIAKGTYAEKMAKFADKKPEEIKVEKNVTNIQKEQNINEY